MDIKKVKELFAKNELTEEVIEVKKYIGISIKDEAISTILDVMIDDDNGFNKINSIVSEIYLETTIISLYTNIEIEDYLKVDEDGNYEYDFSGYDTLKESGLFEHVFQMIGNDVNEFTRLYNLRLNDVLMENNIEYILNRKLNDVHVSIEGVLSKLISKLDLIDKKSVNKITSSLAKSISLVAEKVEINK